MTDDKHEACCCCCSICLPLRGCICSSHYLCSSSRFHREGWPGLTFNRNWRGSLGQANCIQGPGYYQRLREAFLAPIWVSWSSGFSWKARPGLWRRSVRLLAAHPAPEHNITNASNWRTKLAYKGPISPPCKRCSSWQISVHHGIIHAWPARRQDSAECSLWSLQGRKWDWVQVLSAALVTSEPDYRNVRLPPIWLADLWLVTIVWGCVVFCQCGK